MRARAFPSIESADLHIDWSESTVGYATADGTSKGESGVESEAGKLSWLLCSDGIFQRINLDGACRRWWRLSSHRWQCVRGEIWVERRLVVMGLMLLS
jgi:hypothetical protein